MAMDPALADVAALWCTAASPSLSLQQTHSRMESCGPCSVVVKLTRVGGAWPVSSEGAVGSVGVGRVVKCGSNVVVQDNDRPRSLRRGASVAFVLPRHGGSTLATFVEVPASSVAVLRQDERPQVHDAIAAGLDLVVELVLACLEFLKLRMPGDETLDGRAWTQQRVMVLSPTETYPAVESTAMALLEKVFGVTATSVRRHGPTVADRGPFDAVLVLPVTSARCTDTNKPTRDALNLSSSPLRDLLRLARPGSPVVLFGAAPSSPETMPIELMMACGAQGLTVGWSNRDPWMARLEDGDTHSAAWRIALAVATAFLEDAGDETPFRVALSIPCALPNLAQSPMTCEQDTANALALAAEDLRALPRALRGQGAAVVVLQ